MININNNAIMPEEYDNKFSYFIKPLYSNVRKFDRDTATFLDDGKYYETVRIKEIGEKELIMKIAEREKVFGYEENEILNRIMEKHTVETKNNIFDYYD